MGTHCATTLMQDNSLLMWETKSKVISPAIIVTAVTLEREKAIIVPILQLANAVRAALIA